MIQFHDCEAPITKLFLGKVILFIDDCGNVKIGHVKGFSRDIVNNLFVVLQLESSITFPDAFISVLVSPDQIIIGE